MRPAVHWGVVIELFWAEKIGDLEINSTSKCRVFSEMLKLLRTAVVLVFECKCGERTWDE
jgi:hypothetical protein